MHRVRERERVEEESINCLAPLNAQLPLSLLQTLRCHSSSFIRLAIGHPYLPPPLSLSLVLSLLLTTHHMHFISFLGFTFYIEDKIIYEHQYSNSLSLSLSFFFFNFCAFYFDPLRPLFNYFCVF